MDNACHLRKIPAILIGLFTCSAVFAQDTSLKALPGTYRNAVIDQALKTAAGLNQLNGTDRANVVSNLTLQHRLLMNTPSLTAFNGMEARLYGYVKPASAFQERTSARMEVMLYPFRKDVKKGKAVPVDEAPATLSVVTNDLDPILAQYPRFFDKFPAVEAAAGYLEIKANGRIFRILQLNDKPIFVPVTRKEFIQFLVTEATHNLHENEKIVADNLERAKKAPDNSKKIYEEAIAVWQKKMEEAAGEVRQLKDALSQMTPEQAATGTYINHHKSGGYYAQLAAAGRKDGTALYKANPGYYDKSKSRSAAQLVIVSYWCHSQFCPAWVQSYTRKLFDEIDYAALKKEMK